MIYLFLIFIASCLNNLIIPYFIYWRKYGLFKQRKKGFIGVNLWGVIMDGILAGLINMITLNFLLEIKPIVTTRDIIISLSIGFIFMISCHIYMSVKKWQIWIMPKPWQWNAAGYWHMFSMTIQMAYVIYVFLILFSNPALFVQSITIFTVFSTLLLGILFVSALKVHLKGLRIGKIIFSNKPW